MDLLEIAQDERRRLLDEIEALNWFLRVADDLFAEHQPASEQRRGKALIQFGPNLDAADFQRLVVEEYRRRREATAAQAI